MSATRNAGSRHRDFLRLCLLIARRDYLRAVRRRGYVFGTLLLPGGIALLLAVSGFFSLSGSNPDAATVHLVVINESPVRLVNEPPVVPDLQVVTREQGLEMLGSGSVDAVYLVPARFPDERTITRFERSGSILQLSQRQVGSLETDMLAAILRNSVLIDAGLPVAIATSATAPISVVTVTREGEPISETAVAASFIVPLVFTLLFVMSIFITSGYLLQSVTEEKENRVVEIVLSSVPALPLMAGKIAGLGAAGLTQVVVWIVTALVAVALLGASSMPIAHLPVSPQVIGLAIVYFVLGYLAFGAIFAAIGALAPGNREAQQYSGFFGFFAVIPLVLSGLYLSDPNSPLVVILALIPLTAPATMLQVIALSASPPPLLVAASLASLITFVILATVACARIFRATVLLYGARPSMSQIMAAIRTGT